MLSKLLWRLSAALLSAVYWFAVAWLCFAATGLDPLDAITVSGSAAGVAGVLAITVAAVLAFAAATRAWASRGSREERARG